MKKKRYLVTYRLVGEQTVWVEACTVAEAKRKAVGGGHNVDPIDFVVLHPLISTAEVERVEEINNK